MTQVEVELKARADKAEKEIQSLRKELEKVTQAQKDFADEAKGGFKDAEKATGGFLNGVKKIGKGIGQLGKLTGIVFLVTEAFNILKDIFQQNQTVVDAVEVATTALSLAFNDLFKFISSNVGTITGFFKELFENPTEKIKELGTAIKDGVIKRLEQGLEALGLFGKAMLKFFSGDLTGAAALGSQAFTELFDVVTGEDGGLETIKEGFTKAKDALVDYTVSTVNSAKEIVAANKSVAFTEAELERQQLKSNIQAERQRQIRDDDTKSIKDRIAANEELGKIQEKQIQREKELAQQLLNAALLNEKKLPNDEAAVAVLEARNRLLEIQERIEGQASEQLSNKIALERELNDLNETAIEGQNRRAIEAQKFNDELIEGDLARLLQQKQTLDAEVQLERDRLNAKIALYAEGTQARMDAEQELLDFEQEKQLEGVEIEKATQAAKLDVASQTFGNLAAIFGEASGVGKAAAIAQTTIDTYAAAQAAYKSMVGIPVVGPALGAVAAAAAVAGGIANVKKITAIGDPVEKPSVPTGRQAQAPAFNIVGSSPENQLAQVIGEQEQQPVKAYVVSNEVSNQQALDRNIQSTASLG